MMLIAEVTYNFIYLILRDKLKSLKEARWHIGVLSALGSERPGSNLDTRLKFIELEMMQDLWDSKYLT